MKIIRNKTYFFAFSAILALAAAAACLIYENIPARIIFAVAGILAETALTLHFFSIKYAVSDNCLEIKSGIFFKRVKKIAIDKIILTSRFYIGKTVVLTVIKTAGPSSVIFGDIIYNHAL